MFFKNLLFPKLCLICNFLGSYLCSQCEKKLKPLEKQICIYCDKASYLGLTHPICKRSQGIDGFVAFFRYNTPLKKYIAQIKYRLVFEALDDLLVVVKPEILELLGTYIRLKKNITVQAVPLHIKKEKIRGFNQADLIAQHIGLVYKKRVVHLIARIKDTMSQAQLHDDKKRYYNMMGAFSLYPGIAKISEHILLVDDVVTTGSTVKEAVKILKKNGAQSVFVLALAKG